MIAIRTSTHNAVDLLYYFWKFEKQIAQENGLAKQSTRQHSNTRRASVLCASYYVCQLGYARAVISLCK